MLTDAVDGVLTPEDQAAFDRHLLGCTACSAMLADAKRGAAWMEMLREHTPEPPTAMVDRILAQTSGLDAAASGTSVTAQAAGVRGLPGGFKTDVIEGIEAVPLTGVAGEAEGAAGALPPGKVLPFRSRMLKLVDLRGVGHTLLQPRLAMTAAMAFFSIALTLNLTGVRLSELRASDLKPSSLKRSMYEANAHVVRYYTNLRVVYELESRVRDLQRSSDSEPAAVSPQSSTPAGDAGPKDGNPGSKPNGTEPKSRPKQRANPGTSRREPLRDERRVLASNGNGELLVAGVAEPMMLRPKIELHRKEGGLA